MEGVAKPNETSSFVRRIDIQDTGQVIRLVRNHANRRPIHPAEADHNIFGILRHHFQELALIA